MKKKVLLLLLLAIATVSSAQTININYKKGDVRTYTNSTNISVGAPMQGEQKASTTATVQYTVKDADANGYTVEMKTLDYSFDGSEEMAQQASNGTLIEALKTPAVLKLDRNGVITDLVNSDEILARMAEAAVAIINKTYEKHPELEKVMPKAKTLMATNEQINKENALKNLREMSIFNYNGKDFKAGEAIDEELMDMVKVKSTYTVTSDNGSTVISRKSESNMNEGDIKSLIKQQMKKSGADDSATAMIDNAWGQMKAMGMTRLDLDSNGTSAFDSAGWLSSRSENNTTSVMGAKIKLTSTTAIKN